MGLLVIGSDHIDRNRPHDSAESAGEGGQGDQVKKAIGNRREARVKEKTMIKKFTFFVLATLILASVQAGRRSSRRKSPG
jgi:hypothetical protein